MRLRTLTIALLFLVGSISAGCGRSSKKKKAGEAEQAGQSADVAQGERPAAEADETWNRMVLLLEQIAGLAEANQDDCDEMALQIQKLIDGNAKLLAKAKSIEKGSILDKTMQEKYQQRMMSALAKLMPAMKQCQDNKALGEAMKKLDP